MPELRITESQEARFDALREELAAEHAGPYASVTTQDVVSYLLDLADEVDDLERTLQSGAVATTASTATESADADEPPAESTPAADDSDPGGTEPSAGGGPGGMLNLLEQHDDKWREGSGEERYEVELEDGTVETARTKDDVKAILFRNY